MHRFIKFLFCTALFSGGFLLSRELDNLLYNYPVANVQTVNVGQHYYHQLVILDGLTYKNCTFEDVVFLFDGRAPIFFYDNKIIGPINILDEKGEVGMAMLEPYIQPPLDDTPKPQDPSNPEREL